MPLDQQLTARDITLIAPSITCAGCIRPIETALQQQAGVLSARVNLTNRQVKVSLDPALTDADRVIDTLAGIGIDARAAAASDDDAQDRVGRDLLLRLGVAGFAMMNVMLLSISVWSGADGAVRDLLHWASALIALPAIAFSGMPFFRSAVKALRHRRMNMDVPITLAIALSAASSLFETGNSGEHAFFDAGIMLIFFLLVGRYLEHRMRGRARSAAAQLLKMTGRYAFRVLADGTKERIATGDIQAGMTLLVGAGARFPADGRIVGGRSELDCALITGESDPVPVETGDDVFAGVLNLTGPVTMTVSHAAGDTHLAEISRLVEAAENSGGRIDRIAERAARIYAPAVHILAGLALIGWLAATGDLRLSVQIAAAVLIITCPCALALAIPTVRMTAGGWLFRNGIYLKSGDALERLADVDTVVLDKTGTVTTGTPELIDAPPVDDQGWAVAAALAEGSLHPHSQAIATRARELGISAAQLTSVREHPGQGMSGIAPNGPVRMGRPEWLGVESDASVVLQLPDGPHRDFRIRQQLRPDATNTCDELQRMGLSVMLLSGDRATTTHETAARLGIARARGEVSVRDKHDTLCQLQAKGHRTLMVGDGLNDTPALAAADVSIAPCDAADIAQNVADIVFTGKRLSAVPTTYRIARLARRRGLECIAIAIAYNLIAVPVALAGFVTPLFAAVAMSASSLAVVLNAIRMGDTR